MGKDRTKEFKDYVKSKSQRSVDFRPLPKNQFTLMASKIAKNLNQTIEKMENLTKLVKRKSNFNDNPIEIQELTQTIKHELNELNASIAELKNIEKKDPSIRKGQVEDHANNIVISLQSKLATTSNDFKNILELRTKNVKEKKDRTLQYTTGDFPKMMNPSNPSSALYKSNEKDGEFIIDMSQSQMQLVDQSVGYAEERSEEIRNIESTIQQLGQIFQQLAILVQQQGEQLARIDSNIDDLESNVSRGKDELIKALDSTSSNRWLIIKIFAVLISFFIVFIFFFA